MNKYKVGTLFKNTLHLDSYYSISEVPEYEVRKSKQSKESKVVFKTEMYVLERYPDLVKYKSKYDDQICVYQLKPVKITEEQIDKNISSGIWKVE